MSYGRVTPDMLRHMARLMELSLADGEWSIEVNNFDYVGDHDYSRDIRRAAHGGDRYRLDMNVYGSAPSVSPQRQAYERFNAPAQAEREYQQFAAPKAPPIDYKPSLERFVEIVKVIVRAWAMDDNKIRFALLELD